MRSRAVLAALVFLAAAHARADEPARDPAAAEQLFEKAKKLWADGRFDDACAKFEASFKLDPSPSALVKIARCHERVGELAQTLSAYQAAKKLNAESGRAGHKRALERTIDEAVSALEPRVPHLTLTIDPSSAADVVVRRDGAALPIAALGEPLPCDLGPMHLVASAPGFLDAAFDITLSEGEQRAVVLHLEPQPTPPTPTPDTSERAPTAAPPKDAPPLVRPAQQAPASDPGATQRFAGIAIGGAGLGALAGAFGLGVVTLVKVQASADHCNEADQCQPAGLRLRDEASTLQTGAIILGVAGAALFGVGLPLALTAPLPASPPSSPGAPSVAGASPARRAANALPLRRVEITVGYGGLSIGGEF